MDDRTGIRLWSQWPACGEGKGGGASSNLEGEAGASTGHECDCRRAEPLVLRLSPSARLSRPFVLSGVLTRSANSKIEGRGGLPDKRIQPKNIAGRGWACRRAEPLVIPATDLGDIFWIS